MQWTERQQSAIKIRDKNLLVAAAAGSGKTAVLVERIIRMILDDNLDVDRMLIVTFTNAAAQEMRSRIHKKIFERMTSETDSEKLLRLERQSILLSGASITTFHAFCLSVLRRNFSKINFDPKSREANEQELNILRQEVIENLFEEKYSNDENFLKFTDEFNGTVYGDADLYKLIISLYDFAQSRPYPEQWLQSLADFYENPETATLDDGRNWFEFLTSFSLRKVHQTLDDALKICTQALEIAAAQNVYAPNAKPKDLDAYKKNWLEVVQTFLNDKNLIEQLIHCGDDWDKNFSALASLKFGDYPKTRKFPDDLIALKSQLLVQRNKYKDTKKIEKLRELVPMSREKILAQIKKMAASVRQLAQTTIDFERAFSAAKRARGVIDFSDMEHLALKILNSDETTAENYRRKFRVVMVDEYQDTNGVQEEIISKIVGRKNFFAVGDVKQSIYRFRHADPEIFMTKYDAYPADPNSQRVDLSTNFRSRRPIVDAVNEIFRRVMTKAATGIDYNEDAALNFGANYPDAENIFDDRAEFLIVNLEDETAPKNSSDEDDSDEVTAQELDELGLQIQIIADKIKSMIRAGKKIWDDEQKIYRALTYKDIVILMRSVDNKAAKIVDVLQKNSIPAYAADSGGYFRAPEILTTLSLLNVLDNARQDIPLASVLLSPIVGFTEEDLATLRLTDKRADLFTLVKNFSEGDTELSARCKNFLDKLNAWRELARQIGVPELLIKIYRETGYYDYFGTKIDGKVAQANLRMLIDRAAEFEATAFRGLSRFIQFIKKIRELENDLAAARTLGENEDVVHVMTIHKSKGLEFPVVFVAQLDKHFNFRETSEAVIAHRDLGVGVYDVTPTSYGLTRMETFLRKAIQNKVKLEILAEELRIFYVAMTRAREKLFLVGGVKNGSALENSSDEKISTSKIQSAQSAMEWLLMIFDAVQKVAKVEIFAKAEIKLGDDEISAEEKKIAPPPEVAEESVLSKIPAKLSVSEIKQRVLEAEEDTARLLDFGKKKFFDKARLYRRPKFMQEKNISSAEFGTLMHRVMQHLNLGGTLDAEDISAQIDEMISAQILTDEQGDLVKKNIANIEKFFASEIGLRVVNATEIYRELPFNQQIDAATVDVENFQRAAGEKIFVQGIIDLLFKDAESGEWILLDYKTDRNNTDEYFRHEYREQIRLYVQAIENLTSIKIAEKYLYLLTAGRLIRI